jgi:7,8-dihydropterin-6-yl-methyl-4-(beta-D-ribofuranosyl)aminobenzene 5'-phosphate synthase
MAGKLRLPVLLFSLALCFPLSAQQRIHKLQVRILSTMLADAGVGEWGFAALVEADGHRILIDTGARPDTVLKNAAELGIDLSGITEVVLTHHDDDHIGGLVTLRRKYPSALSRVHVGKGIFWSRPGPGNKEGNSMIAIKAAYEGTGGVFIEHDKPVQLLPGAWLTGPVPRVHPERNWSVSGKVKTPEGLVEDTIPEDQSLVFDTDKGLVLLSGCGHAGVVNAVEYARRQIREAPLYAAIGGFHLFPASDEALDWTAQKLREFGLRNLMGAHCTGIEAVYRIRDRAGLSRKTAVVGAVGAGFDLAEGLKPGRLAR